MVGEQGREDAASFSSVLAASTLSAGPGVVRATHSKNWARGSISSIGGWDPDRDQFNSDLHSDSGCLSFLLGAFLLANFQGLSVLLNAFLYILAYA